MQYVKANGIVKSACNGIQGLAIVAALSGFGLALFKRIKAKLSIKWHLHKVNKRINKSIQNSNGEPYEYDENGYRLTNDERYEKNKKEFAKIEKLYTDDNMDTVKLIQMHDPARFKGMNMDQKLEYVDKNNLKFEDLLYEFGLDKDTQVRRHIAEEKGIPVDEVTNEDLQAFWNQSESLKVGISSKVKKGYKKYKSKKKKEKEQLKLFTPIDYYAMEVDYGVQNYASMNPSDIPPELKARRIRFDECMKYAAGWLNLVYTHNRDKFNAELKKANNNVNTLWRMVFIQCMEDDNSFNEIRKAVGDQLGLLASEAKGHHPSTLPSIQTLEDADYVDKLETELDRLNDIRMKAKCNVPLGVDEDLDEDEDEDDDDVSTLEDIDIDKMSFSETEYILDQLDALRNGEDLIEENSKSDPEDSDNVESNASEINSQVHTVLEISDNNDEISVSQNDNDMTVSMSTVTTNAPGNGNHQGYSYGDDSGASMEVKVFDISPEKYTIEYRAKLLLTMYADLCSENRETAYNEVQTILDDPGHENFKVYEVSNEMKHNRQRDREHKLPFKIIESDYEAHEDFMNASREYAQNAKEYGASNWKKMLEDKENYYYDAFEFTCVEKMLENLNRWDLEDEDKAYMIAMLQDNGYEVMARRALYPELESIYNKAEELLKSYNSTPINPFENPNMIEC